MNSFQVAFTGKMYVPFAGAYTFHSYFDGEWVLGFGTSASQQQPTYGGGISSGIPAITHLSSYKAVGGSNTAKGADQVLTVAFPAAGVYPFELDYSETTGGGLRASLNDNSNQPISN